MTRPGRPLGVSHIAWPASRGVVRSANEAPLDPFPLCNRLFAAPRGRALPSPMFDRREGVLRVRDPVARAMLLAPRKPGPAAS